MVRSISPVCEVLRDERPPEPGPGALHVVILGVEATGRMIVGDFTSGCGATGELIASATTLGQQVGALLGDHPHVQELRLYVPERLGIGAERVAEWVSGVCGQPAAV